LTAGDEFVEQVAQPLLVAAEDDPVATAQLLASHRHVSQCSMGAMLTMAAHRASASPVATAQTSPGRRPCSDPGNASCSCPATPSTTAHP